jgi:hypothetical protein
MDGDASGGTLTTRVLRFRGQRLFVNVAARDGELRVEILDREGQIVEPFSRPNCLPIKVDRTLQMVEWQGNTEVSSLNGKPVRFRFSLTNGRLYAFWVSTDLSGASHGYVAAGGPGFKGPRDIVASVVERE